MTIKTQKALLIVAIALLCLMFGSIAALVVDIFIGYMTSAQRHTVTGFMLGGIVVNTGWQLVNKVDEAKGDD